MRTPTAIIVPRITELVAETRDMVTDLHEAEHRVTSLGKAFEEAQQVAQTKRMLLGRQLLKVRGQLPKRGTPEHGWGAFLEAIEIDEATAWRYMKLAEATANLSPEKDKVPSYSEIGLDRREGPQPDPDAPPPGDDDAPPELGEPTPVDRDTWCTPKWITDAIGKVDLDPCANERSHVQASSTFRLDFGEDGLERAASIGHDWRVFVNPPYSNVMPWVQAYKHTRFCFLVKFDPSTAWCELLLGATSLILFPRRTRIEFEAPPGVESSSNQFPHGLFYARAEDATAEIRAACFEFRKG